MKNIILLISVILISFSSLQAQPKKMTEELKKIRRQKFMESVSMDDATADKYFSIFDVNFESIMTMNKQRKDDMEYIENNSDAADITAKVEDLLDLDAKILEKKKDLYSQLKAFLTPKQIGQSLVFQYKFNKELKKQIDKKKDKHPNGR